MFKKLSYMLICLTLFSFTASALDIDLRSTTKTNATADHGAAPLEIIIFQLRDNTDFDKADYFGLLDTPNKVLGGDLVDKISYVIAPSSHKTLRIKLDRRTHFIGVMAAYENYNAVVWRTSIKVDENDENLDFTFDKNGLVQNKSKITVLKANNYFDMSLGYGFGYQYPTTSYLWYETSTKDLVVNVEPEKFDNPYLLMFGAGYQWRPSSDWLNTLGVNTMSAGIDFLGVANLNSSGIGASELPYDYDNKVYSFGLLMNGKVSFLPNSVINPFLTAGIGLGMNQDYFTRVDTTTQTTDEKNLLTTTAGQFIYEYGLGVDYAASQRISLSLSYEFFNLGQAVVQDNDPYDSVYYHPKSFSLPIQFSAALFSFRYNFAN